MKKEDALEFLFLRCGNYFLEQGFKGNSAKNKWKRSNSNFIDEFDISISPRPGGGLTHHLRASFFDKRVSGLFKMVERAARSHLDLPDLNILRSSASITDWKEVLAEAGTLENGIWLSNFDDLRKMEDLSQVYRCLIDVGIGWFDSFRDYKNIKNFNFPKSTDVSMGVYLSTVKVFEPANLNCEYKHLIEYHSESKGWSRSEVSLYFDEMMKI
jgi:hypothetical protein